MISGQLAKFGSMLLRAKELEATWPTKGLETQSLESFTFSAEIPVFKIVPVMDVP